MAADQHAHDLEDLLNQLENTGSGGGQVSVHDIYERIGHRSYGPLLLVPALVALTPIGAIPTLPTVLAVIVIALASQLMVGKKSPWLPQILLRRKISKKRLEKSLGYARPLARMVDRLIRPRLKTLTHGPFVHVMAAFCVMLALAVPPLELVPFGSTPAWFAIALIGLALFAHDGLLAAVAMILTAISVYLPFKWF